MGSSQISYFSFTSKHFIIYLLLLLLSSSTLFNFTAQGRPISHLLEESTTHKENFEEKMVVRRQIIGSTPPRCDRRCSWCSHCEAIQVPVTTKYQKNHLISSSSTTFSNIAYSRGDDISNYKPMSWKCKCGNLIFNP